MKRILGGTQDYERLRVGGEFVKES